MDKLIHTTHEKWLQAKNYAAKRCRRSQPDVAVQLDNCAMFTGEENLQELTALMFTPQGREFMLANRFPTLTHFRKFKQYNPEQYGVYIDAGSITINEPGNVYLIGNTTAEIYCRKTQSHNIILMHGATAKVYASGYAVVKIETDRKSTAETFAAQSAKIL